MTTQTVWFFARDGQQVGPITELDLRAMAANGSLLPSQLVWQSGWPAWMPASSVPGLMFAGGAGSAGRGAAAPPPVPSSASPATFVPQYASPSMRPPDIGEHAGIRMLIPVGRSGWAIAAGYLGLFSVLVIPAPVAVIIALIALRDIKHHPHRHGMGRAIFGLVMGGLVTGGVLIALVSSLMR